MKMDLFKAVRDGDSSSVFRMLLRKQSAVNFTDRNGLSPLFVALVNCRSDVAHCLLDNGAYIDHALPSGLTPLLLCHLLLFPADTFLYRPPSLSRLLAAADRIAELCTTRERRKSEVGRRRDVDVTSWLRRDSEKALSGGEELKATVCYDGDASIRAAGGGTRRDEAAGDERVRRGGATDCVAAASSIDTRSWRSVCSLQLSLSEDIVNKLAEYTSHNCLVSLEQGDFTLDKVQWKAAHISRQRALDNMVDLLLSSGAACDLSGSPLPPLFVPLCCLNIAAVRRLLSAGADANAILDSPTGVLRPLQIACALRTSVAVEIVRMLLDALAHPDCHMTTTRNMDETLLTIGLGSSEEAGHSDGQEGGWTTDHYGDGRLKEGLDLALAACTPLQIACACGGNCENSQKVAQVLLQYGADPNVVSATHGHSALSVAVAHGNQPAVVTLLKAGADPNLQLGCGLNSSVCVAVSCMVDRGHRVRDMMALVEMLIAAGADILLPVVMPTGEAGTLIDFSHHVFDEHERLSNYPRNRISKEQREVKRDLQAVIHRLAHLMRAADERRTVAPPGCLDGRPSERLSHCGECGRSLGTVLTPCRRCNAVAFCSNVCRVHGWKMWHKHTCGAGGARLMHPSRDVCAQQAFATTVPILTRTDLIPWHTVAEVDTQVNAEPKQTLAYSYSGPHNYSYI